MSRKVVKRKVWITGSEGEALHTELLPREIPFEIQVRAGQTVRNVANLTRTPGNDYELTAGLLLSEGYVQSRHDFSHMTYCVADAARQEYNLLSVVLRQAQMPEPLQPEQVVVEGVVCGVSSQSLLEALQQRHLPAIPQSFGVPASTLLDAVRIMTNLSEKGTVQAALFAKDGTLQEQRQDVDGLNALDKLIGWGVLQEKVPFYEQFVFVTANATFALLQRCAVAGVPLVAISGIPSSLAVSVASRFGIAVAGVEGEQVLVYAGHERVV